MSTTVPHQAGIDGNGESSYIDLAICRNKDANTAWTSASDGVLEERLYYCQNWRADVSAIVTSSGTMKEWVKYSAYGIPFGMPGGDANSSGATDTTDVNQVQTWINGSIYDVRGDIDLNGTVDATDKSTIRNNFGGTALGRSHLSAQGIENRKCYAGGESSGVGVSLVHLKHRVLNLITGYWIQRDPLGLDVSTNLYEYCFDAVPNWVDPLGLQPGIGGLSWGTSNQGLGRALWHLISPPPPPPPPPDCANQAATNGSGACSQYPANSVEACVCGCMGNSPWEDNMRGCLICEMHQGMGFAQRHAYCAAAATANHGAPDAGTAAQIAECGIECLLAQF